MFYLCKAHAVGVNTIYGCAYSFVYDSSVTVKMLSAKLTNKLTP